MVIKAKIPTYCSIRCWGRADENVLLPGIKHGVKHTARRHLWSLFSFPSVCSFVNHSHHPYLLVWDECSQFHWIIGSLFNNKETLLIKERYFKKFCNRTVLWGLFFYFYGLCEQLLLIYSRCVCIYFLMTFIYNIPFVISL